MAETDTLAEEVRETRLRIARHLADLHRLHLGLAEDSRALKRFTLAGRPGFEIEIAAELIEQRAGRLDVLWDIPGVGAWPDVKAAAEPIDLGEGDTCLVLGLDALIAAKRSLGRTRDLIAVEELEERPLEEHVGVFEAAQSRLRQALDDRSETSESSDPSGA